MNRWSKYALLSVILIGFGLRILYASLSVDVADAYLHLVSAKSMRDCWCIPSVDSWGTSYLFRPPSGLFWMALFMPYPLIAVVLAGMLLVGLAYLVARRLGLDEGQSLFSAAVVAVAPIAVSFSSTDNLDMFTALYALAALYALLKDRISLSAVFSGLSFLAKTDGIVFVLVPMSYLVWRKEWKKLAVFLVIFCGIALVWSLRVWMIFQNPVYPYFEGVFGHPQTPVVGHKVALPHYLMGLPLSFFGVPEGDSKTAIALAQASGFPVSLVWIAYGVAILGVAAMAWGLYRLLRRVDDDSRFAVAAVFVAYGIFFAVRTVMPIGSDVFDLRYSLIWIPLLAIGVAVLPSKVRWSILFIFLAGSFALGARFLIAQQAFAPYAQALEEVRNLPSDSVILSDMDTTVFAYGISYSTGRVGFPYLENPFNGQVHIPFLKGEYSAIRARGPNFLWTRNMSRSCDNMIYENEAIKICALTHTPIGKAQGTGPSEGSFEAKQPVQGSPLPVGAKHHISSFGYQLRGANLSYLLSRPRDLYILSMEDVNLTEDGIAALHSKGSLVVAEFDVSASKDAIQSLIGEGYDGILLGGSGLDKVAGREAIPFDEEGMIKTIRDISDFARSKDPSFLILVKNRVGLSVQIKFLSAIDGLLKEDTWYEGDTPLTAGAYSSDLLAMNQAFINGKFILAIDYPRGQAARCDFLSKARSNWLIPSVGTRSLDAIEDLPRCS